MNVNIAPHPPSVCKNDLQRNNIFWWRNAMNVNMPPICMLLSSRERLKVPPCSGESQASPLCIYICIYIYMYVCYIYIILYIKCHPWHGNPVLNIGVLDSLHQATIPAPRRHVRRAHRPSVWVWLKAKPESQRDSIVMSQWISWLRKLQKLLSIVG